MQDLAPEALVAEQGADVPKAGEASMAVFLPKEGGVSGVEAVIKGVRVLEKGGVVWVGAAPAIRWNVGDRLKLGDRGNAWSTTIGWKGDILYKRVPRRVGAASSGEHFGELRRCRVGDDRFAN